MSSLLKWNLKEVYMNDDEWNRDKEEALKLLIKINNYANRVTLNNNNIKSVLDLKEKLSIIISRMYQYAKMGVDTNNFNYRLQKKLVDIKGLIKKCEKESIFIATELQSMEDKDVKLILQDNSLKKYHYFLSEMLRLKKHTLSTKEETILSSFGEITDQPHKIFTGLFNMEIDFENELLEGVKLDRTSYYTFLKNKDRSIRKNAYKNYNKRLISHKYTFFNSLLLHAKQNSLFSQLRGYDSVLSGQLAVEGISEKFYDDFKEQVCSKLHLLHDYIKVKKAKLKVDKFYTYDLYVSNLDLKQNISFEKAKDIIIQALLPLGDDYSKCVEEIFKDKRIDLLPKKDKVSGSYCWEVYPHNSYILTNFNGDLDSLFALIHEIGHAIHNKYAFKANSFCNANPTELTSEIASNVNEILLYRYLTVKFKEIENYQWHFLDRVRSIFFRQFMLSEFEEALYDKVDTLSTPNDLSKIYLNLIKKYYGDDFSIDVEAGIEWTRIPHFYNTFYVYKYSVGFSLAHSIVNNISNNYDLVNKYIGFLELGGSKSNQEILNYLHSYLVDKEYTNMMLYEFQKTLNEVSD